MAEKGNRRQFARSKVCARAELRLNCGVVMEARTRDVSMKGLLVESERSLPVGNACTLRLELDEGGETHRICMEGSVVRVDPSGMGIEITRIDVISLGHLRNLVWYAQEDNVHREAISSF